METTARLTWWVLLVTLGIFAGCTKEEEPKPLPSLEAVRPESAAVGATVTLIGSDFSTDPGKNTVTFSGVPAAVQQATATELVVRVPAGAYLPERPYAEVRVSTEGRAASWPFILKSDFYPDVFSVTPQVARAGDVVTINGQNLSRDLTQTKILFLDDLSSRGFPTFPTVSTGTALQVTVPSGITASEIWVILYTKSDGSKYISRILPVTIRP